MALAKKCDRCEALYEPETVTINGQKVNGILLIDRCLDNRTCEHRGYRDLCPRCLNDLIDFLKKPVQFAKEG